MVRNAGDRRTLWVTQIDREDKAVIGLAARRRATLDLGDSAFEAVLNVFTQWLEVLPVVAIEAYRTSAFDLSEFKQFGDRSAGTLNRHMEQSNGMDELIGQLIATGAVGQQPVFPVLDGARAARKAMADECQYLSLGR